MCYALAQKAAGHIRFLGVTSHNPAAALAAVESGLVDVLMFSVNPCYDLLPGTENCEDLWADASYANPLVNMDPARERLYETCQRLGAGITVMKAFGGGDLLTANSPAGAALTASQCIHYALTRPAVATVLSGVRSLDDLKKRWRMRRPRLPRGIMPRRWRPSRGSVGRATACTVATAPPARRGSMWRL